MRYRIEIEQRYKLHKLARETRHYEELFGIVHVLGEVDERRVNNILISLVRDEAHRIIKQWRGNKKLRIYLNIEELRNVLTYFGYNIRIDEKYEYVLIIEPTTI